MVGNIMYKLNIQAALLSILTWSSMHCLACSLRKKVLPSLYGFMVNLWLDLDGCGIHSLASSQFVVSHRLGWWADLILYQLINPKAKQPR